MKRLVFLISFLFLFACGEQRFRVQEPFDPEKPPIIDGLQMEQVYEGVDHQGNRRSCEPMDPDTMCSQVFTESDQYAQECEQLGYQTVACACHDWICIR